MPINETPARRTLRSPRIRPEPLHEPSCTDPDIKFEVLQHSSVGYGSKAGNAGRFFRRNSDEHYSAKSLNDLASIPDMYSDSLNDDRSPLDLPVIVIASKPYSYDTETETKTGGLVGMSVCWRDPGRTLIAVHKEGRRRKIGSHLLALTMRYGTSAPILWVGKDNNVGHVFCLSNGLQMTSMNSTGAVRYSTSDEDGDVS